MRRVFLDTNNLLDIALQREHSYEAEVIVQRGDDHLIQLCASTLSYVNIAYILIHHPLHELYNYEKMLREGVDVLSIDAEQIDYAIANPVSDLEDMIQYRCALAGNCDVIITNNKRDFSTFCSLPFMTASEYLDSYKD